MGGTRNRQPRVNWPFVKWGAATSASSGGGALLIGAVASEFGHPFGRTMLLFTLLGGALMFAYFAVLTSVVTPRMEHRARKLGGNPNLGRAGDTERTGGYVISYSFLVLFVGFGFAIVGTLGVAI